MCAPPREYSTQLQYRNTCTACICEKLSTEISVSFPPGLIFFKHVGVRFYYLFPWEFWSHRSNHGLHKSIFFFQDSVSRVVPIVMELGSCDFAYVRVHRRTGKHRVLEEEEIKRYASEGWIVVPVFSRCLKFNYIFLSVAKFEHALLWARFPRLAWRSRYDLLVLLVYTWRQGGHVGGEEQSLSLLWELNSIFM